MSLTTRGFTLPELLLALLLSSLLLSGAARVLPVVQASALAASGRQVAVVELEQLAGQLGKVLQRAGYCAGRCQGKGLTLFPEQQCLFVVWDDNHNGRWEESEYRGYRLRNASLEIHPGAGSCSGPGWERITDPAALAIDRWQVELEPRPGWPPRIIQRLSARAVVRGRALANPVSLSHRSGGVNL